MKSHKGKLNIIILLIILLNGYVEIFPKDEPSSASLNTTLKVSGYVKDNNGNGIPDANINIYFYGETTTDINGYYEDLPRKI